MSKSTGKPNKRQKAIPNEAKRIERRQAPAGFSVESRENQIIRLAYDLAEERIRKKTASSQELTQFLKLGSSLGRLEKAKLEKEVFLLQAKAESLASQQKVEELYRNAMKAFKTYSGQEEQVEDED